MLISILIAFSLNFDTFSVSIVEGSRISHPSIKQSLKIGLIFGFGQALMALFGSFLGIGFKQIIMNADHWIAFVLLCFIGMKMIDESKKDNKIEKTNITNHKSLFLLVVATSIDALVIGITFAFIDSSVLMNISSIGIITSIVSFIGYHAGTKLRKLFKNKVKIIGGLILITIGIKILIQHVFLSG